MSTDQALFSARFGTGLPRNASEAETPAAMLAALRGVDTAARAYPVADFSYVQLRFNEREAYRKRLKREQPTFTVAQINRLTRKKYGLEKEFTHALKAHLARWVEAADPLRERLMLFWADHFTAIGRGRGLTGAEPFYIEGAIRPNLTGRFEDMFLACVTHPLMLRYLDQDQSVSPLSKVGRERDKGLNENLAREALELHSLGVDGPYSQVDVRALAQLLAGLTVGRNTGTRYASNRAHPRPVRLLKRDYGSGRPAFEDVRAALRDIANHPQTARHMARKLAVHFVSDDPSKALIDALETSWRDSGGLLQDVYETLLLHPDAKRAQRAKVKQPFELLATSFKALGVRGQDIMELPQEEMRKRLFPGLRRMGQPWLSPPGPDGWPEEGSAWITPAALSMRLTFFLNFVGQYENRVEPQDALELGLGPLASSQLRFAVDAAESRRDALALILVSPEFQRK